MLKRLLINADAETAARIARFSGYECVPMDGAGPEKEGAVVVVLRPHTGLGDTLEAVRTASARGLPVVVVAGCRDAAGESILREARACGVPGACVLLVEGGKVVDAVGGFVAEALRGTGIGVRAVVNVAEKAVRESLVPEMAVWDGGEEALWEAEPVDRAAELEEAEPADRAAETESTPSPASLLLENFLSAAERTVAVLGVKSGVGATTLAACLAGVLEDADPLHLEVSTSPSGYLYYGPDPGTASRTGKYAAAGGAATGSPRSCGVLIADVSLREAVDAAYDRADCVVVVTDGSPVAFERVKRWVQGGWRLDVLAVNRVLPGAGYPPEVYMGELGLDPKRVVGVPGGSEEEMAVNLAQQKHSLPFGKSVDFDGAVADLGRAVREVLEGGKAS